LTPRCPGGSACAFARSATGGRLSETRFNTDGGTRMLIELCDGCSQFLVYH
jgi:predicted dithiol-disulfide oxidoreductase (DUF899 family)